MMSIRKLYDKPFQYSRRNNDYRNIFRSGILVSIYLVTMVLTACDVGSKESELDLSSNIATPADQRSVGSASRNTPFVNNGLTEGRLRSLIAMNRLTGDPMRGRSIPNIQDKKPQLGMHLFFSKSLSGDRDSACVSCHHPALGGGDALTLPIGVAAENPDLLGPGRLHSSQALHYDGGPSVPRNSPTTFNLAAWDKNLFHDGRVESLGKTPGLNGDDWRGIRTPDSDYGSIDPLSGQNLAAAQARFPVTSPEEMKGFNHDDKDNQGIRDHLAARLGGYGSGAGELLDTEFWLAKFQEAFDAPLGTAAELITEQNIAFSIGEYERSQSFTNTPWKRYVEGDTHAISATAKQGALMFLLPAVQGGASCINCHGGDLFSDEQFHNIAMPQIGRGKGDGADGTADFGRYRETGQASDQYAFRSPSLLNVEVTGPWSHAGAYTTLEAVIKHHLNPAEAIATYDYSQLSQPGIQNLDKLQANTLEALSKLENDRSEGLPAIQKIDLSDEQIAQLVEFLKTLTDPCVKDRSCLSSWIPDSVTDPNGDQLVAIDAFGVGL